jgi:TolA-binding protein
MVVERQAGMGLHELPAAANFEGHTAPLAAAMTDAVVLSVIAKLEAKLDQMAKDIAELRIEMMARFDQIEARLDRLERP